MEITEKVQEMRVVECYSGKGPSPIPEESKWIQVKEISQISGLSHGVGTCAPHQGCCKLTINVKDGVIQEALIETTGCSGATHGAAVAGEILPGKTILEALNTHLACDAINVAMREVFTHLIYGRSQTAFSENGLPVGSSLEDLGSTLRSQVGTVFSTMQKGPRYLEMAEGYILQIGLDDENEIIGYKYINLGKFMDEIRSGQNPVDAYNKSISTYGQFDFASSYIDPRET